MTTKVTRLQRLWRIMEHKIIGKMITTVTWTPDLRTMNMKCPTRVWLEI